MCWEITAVSVLFFLNLIVSVIGFCSCRRNSPLVSEGPWTCPSAWAHTPGQSRSKESLCLCAWLCLLKIWDVSGGSMWVSLHVTRSGPEPQDFSCVPKAASPLLTFESHTHNIVLLWQLPTPPNEVHTQPSHSRYLSADQQKPWAPQPKDSASACACLCAFRGFWGRQLTPSLLQPAGMAKPAGRVSFGVKTLQKNEERSGHAVHFYHAATRFWPVEQ